MEKQAERARRLLSVLEQLHRIEEQKKIELERRYDELERTQEEILQALNKDDALHGMFIDTSAKFLRSLSHEAQRVATARDEQEEKLLERATKMKTAEKLKETLEDYSSRIRKENELQEVIERYTGRNSASLP